MKTIEQILLRLLNKLIFLGDTMATRSYILIKNKNSYEGVYCHWDGYPDNNGVLLTRYYKNKRKVKQLISLGNLSSLNQKVFPRKPHSYSQPLKGITVAYHRDRKEDFNNIRLEQNFFYDLFQDVNYVYVFDNNKWNCYDRLGLVEIPKHY